LAFPVFFVQATSSPRLVAGTAALTRSTDSAVAISTTGVKLFTGSSAVLGVRTWFTATEFVAKYKVYPSGVDLATTSVAMDEPAPGRFSTTMGCLRFSTSGPSRCA
jgi:hypothetical protein